MPYPYPAHLASRTAGFATGVRQTADDVEYLLTQDKRYSHCLYVEELDPRVNHSDMVPRHASQVSMGYPVCHKESKRTTPQSGSREAHGGAMQIQQAEARQAECHPADSGGAHPTGSCTRAGDQGLVLRRHTVEA